MSSRVWQRVLSVTVCKRQVRILVLALPHSETSDQQCDPLRLLPNPHKGEAETVHDPQGGGDRKDYPIHVHIPSGPPRSHRLQATPCAGHSLECQVLPSRSPCVDSLLEKRGDMTSSSLPRQLYWGEEVLRTQKASLQPKGEGAGSSHYAPFSFCMRWDGMMRPTGCW